jgi:hypothetical protein
LQVLQQFVAARQCAQQNGGAKISLELPSSERTCRALWRVVRTVQYPDIVL